MPLSELRKAENIAAIRLRHAERVARLERERGNRKLVETLGGLENEESAEKACLICQL